MREIDEQVGAPGVLTRRNVLRGLGMGGAGIAFAALVGCGGDDETDGSSGATSSASGGDTSAAIRTTGERPATLPAGWNWDPNLPFPYQFPEPSNATKPGGTMRVAASWDVGPMDPTVSAAGGSITVPNMVYNRLVGHVGGVDVDPFKFKLEPELAASWERSPDGMTVTFRLAKGVKWQNVAPLNGRDFVAADAKFAFERYQSTGVHKSYWTSVTSIEAVDAGTLKVNLARPLVDFVIPLGSRYQTIFPRELVDSGSITKEVVGTGPMILKEAVTGGTVRLEKNPDFWERTVLLDGAEFKVMPDAAARVAAFRAGQVDYAYSPVTTERDVRALLDSNPGLQVNVVPQTYVTTTSPSLNLRNPKYQDVRVRRAISLAVDRDALMNVIWGGLAKALPIIPWIFLFDKEPTAAGGELGNWVRFAPAEAKQLLQAAGAEDLVIEAPYYEYASSDTQRAEFMTDQLRGVGITFKPQKVDYTTYNSQLQSGSWADALAGAYYALGFDADTFFYNQVHSKSPGNRDHITDTEIDSWAEAQQVELNPENRKQIQLKMWNKLMDQVYRPITARGMTFEIYQPWLRGIRFGGALGDNSSYYEWGDQIAEAWLDK
ncbi:MAG: ABC transporter substrate-binding protein [Dehalococcoidia bacterium]